MPCGVCPAERPRQGREHIMSSGEKRFEVIYKEGGGFGASKQILVDHETGVKYLLFFSGYGVAMTPLLDKDGKPENENKYGF